MFGIAETNSLITRRPFAVSGALVSPFGGPCSGSSRLSGTVDWLAFGVQ